MRSGYFHNSIVALNTGINADFAGALNYAKTSLIGISSNAIFARPEDRNIVGSIEAPIDPRLGELSNNGGAIPTHALLANSPALNACNNGLTFATDARGFTRIIAETVDLGAFEFNSAPADLLRTITVNITSSYGRLIGSALITMTNGRGEKSYAVTNGFGFCHFNNVPLNDTLSFQVHHKRARFEPETLIFVLDRFTFMALPPNHN